MKKNIILPKLPRGEGGMSWMPDDKTIIYKKTIQGKRVSVYGLTPKECITKMKEKEKEIEKKTKEINSGSILLSKAITEWHKTFKASGVVLKENSYDREHMTIQNQILKYPISKRQIQAIDSAEIQTHINNLIKDNYSYSTVKKTYELLNQFFNYWYSKNPYDNPMLTIIKPTKTAMNVEIKEVEYFDEEDIKVFTMEATRKYSNGKPVYRLGNGLIVIMLTGMRINEALCLRWKAVNFEEKYIKITANRQRVIDYSKPKRPNGTYVYKTIETTPKTSSGIRKIYLSDEAIYYLTQLKNIQEHNSDSDFIFATKTGLADTERNMRRTLNNIQTRACTTIQNSGLHVLRHTFCSMLCRQGVDEGVVANLLGQKDRDMVQRVYRHVSEKEKIDAVTKLGISDISEIKFIN